MLFVFVLRLTGLIKSKIIRKIKICSWATKFKEVTKILFLYDVNERKFRNQKLDTNSKQYKKFTMLAVQKRVVAKSLGCFRRQLDTV